MSLGSKMVPPRGSLAPIDLQWEKHKKSLLLRIHKVQSFHILCVAMYSGLPYKSCQPCTWHPYRPRPRVVMGKTYKNLLLRNHKAQSFHVLYVAMCSGPLYKSCQPCPWGQKMDPSRGSLAPIDLQLEKHKKSSPPKPQGTELSYFFA